MPVAGCEASFALGWGAEKFQAVLCIFYFNFNKLMAFSAVSFRKVKKTFSLAT